MTATMAAALALLALATTRHRFLTLQPTTTTPRQLPATRRRCRRRPFTFVVLNSRAARARLESLLRDAGGSSTTLGTGPVDLVWSNARRVSKAEAAAAATPQTLLALGRVRVGGEQGDDGAAPERGVVSAERRDARRRGGV